MEDFKVRLQLSYKGGRKCWGL